MKRVLHSLQIVYVRRFSFHSFVHLFVLKKQKKTTFIDNVEHLFEELQIMYAPWYCSHNMNWLLHRFQSSLLMDCLLSLSTTHWARAEQDWTGLRRHLYHVRTFNVCDSHSPAFSIHPRQASCVLTLTFFSFFPSNAFRNLHNFTWNYCLREHSLCKSSFQFIKTYVFTYGLRANTLTGKCCTINEYNFVIFRSRPFLLALSQSI